MCLIHFTEGGFCAARCGLVSLALISISLSLQLWTENFTKVEQKGVRLAETRRHILHMKSFLYGNSYKSNIYTGTPTGHTSGSLIVNYADKNSCSVSSSIVEVHSPLAPDISFENIENSTQIQT